MRAPALAVLAVFMAACSTVQSRIKRHQAAFDASPPAVQEQIRQGQIAVGFTFDQVEMALGAPDRTVSESQPGHEREIWSYGGACTGQPRVGFGIGWSSWHRGGLGTGVGVSTGPGYYACEDRIRVTFEGGRVVDIRRRTR